MRHVSVLLLVLAGIVAASAMADEKLLRNADLVGIETPGQVVRGITGGGLPWVVDHGSKAKVSADGRLKVDVKALVFAPGTPLAGTPGPITSVVGSVVCADGAVASADAVPLSSEGDARIDAWVTLPAGCEDPIVLVRTTTGRWLAEAGL